MHLTTYCPRFARRTLGALPLIALLMAGCDSHESDPIQSARAAFFAGSAASGLGSGPYIGTQGVTVEPLARSGFPDRIDAMFRITLSGGARSAVTNVRDSEDAVVAKLTFEPNGFVGWHTHPGPAIVTIAAGELSIVNESDCVVRTYAAGQAFVDPGQGNVHVAINDTDVATVVYATFLDIPPGVGPTRLLETPADCSL